jgi:hypothetical protein
VITWIRAALLTLLFLSNAARPSSNTTDISGMWWNAAESGWGVGVVLQNDVAFLTFYIYDQARNAVWYSAQANYRGASGGALVWDGPLYLSHGAYYGGPVPPNSTNTVQTGQASFRLDTIEDATLTYTISGVTVTKAISRLTFRTENYSGNYAGGYSIRATGCVPTHLNGIEEKVGFISVTHNGSTFAASLSGTNPACTFTGTYTQAGNLGNVAGNYSCTNGTQGTFNLFEITPTISGFNGRMDGRNQYCAWSGYFGGILRSP